MVQRETSGEFIHHGNYICYFVIDIRHKQYAFLEIGAKIRKVFDTYRILNHYFSIFEDQGFLDHLRDGRTFQLKVKS